MRKFFCIIICFIVLSCGNQNEKKEIQKTKESFLTDHEVILTDSDHHDYLKRQFNYSTWNPSKKDIQIVRSAVEKSINDDRFFMLKDPVEAYFYDYYYFQYLPYQNKSGDQFIMVNAFCKQHFDIQLAPIEIDGEMVNLNLVWTKHFIEVADGGWCYWQMKVNVETGEYFDLHINGNG